MRPSIPIAAKYLARLYDRLDEREQCAIDYLNREGVPYNSGMPLDQQIKALPQNNLTHDLHLMLTATQGELRVTLNCYRAFWGRGNERKIIRLADSMTRYPKGKRK